MKLELFLSLILIIFAIIWAFLVVKAWRKDLVKAFDDNILNKKSMLAALVSKILINLAFIQILLLVIIGLIFIITFVPSDIFLFSL